MKSVKSLRPVTLLPRIRATRDAEYPVKLSTTHPYFSRRPASHVKRSPKVEPTEPSISFLCFVADTLNKASRNETRRRRVYAERKVETACDPASLLSHAWTRF